jgi:hypothetical protein
MPKHSSGCCLLPKFKDYLEGKMIVDKKKKRENKKGGCHHGCVTSEYYTMQKAYNLCCLCYKRGHWM